jgi:alkylhydroperoxidase family enzyme
LIDETFQIVPYVGADGSASEYSQKLAELRDRMGFVPNSMGFYYHRPAIAEAILQLVKAVGHDAESTLDRQLKRKLALVCSSTNGCVYCTAHQCSFLSKPKGFDAEGWGLNDAEIAGLMAGTWVSTDEAEQCCLEFAKAASADPASVPRTLLERMKASLTPAQIVEVAAVVGMWKCLNSVHDSLSLPLEEELETHAERFKLRKNLG